MIGRTHFVTRSYGHQIAGNYTRSQIGRQDSLQRGLIFLSIAGVAMVIGCILTGIGVPKLNHAQMTAGPVLIGVSVLMFLLTIREYFVFSKHRVEMRRIQFESTGVGALAALTVSKNNRLGAITFAMEDMDEPKTEILAYKDNAPQIDMQTEGLVDSVPGPDISGPAVDTQVESPVATQAEGLVDSVSVPNISGPAVDTQAECSVNTVPVTNLNSPSVKTRAGTAVDTISKSNRILTQRVTSVDL